MASSGRVLYSDPVLGPFGTYFGRSVAEANALMVPWAVPNSGGQVVLVHNKALPAFQRVTAGLAAEALNGNTYLAHSATSFNARTISGTRQLSRHALGLAIDINPVQNPYRSDNKLITNMPQWFVDVWREAGFCWGGDWRYSKDPMHFSYIGPAASPINDPFDPIIPKTSKKAFGSPVATHATEFAPVMERYNSLIADAKGNGAPDVVGIRSHPDGSVIDIAGSSKTWGECSLSRWFVPDQSVASADFTVLADIDSDSGQDLVALHVGTDVVATTATRIGEFEDLDTSTTGLHTDLTAVAGADFNGDRIADLWESRTNGDLNIYGGEKFDVLLSALSLPSGAPVEMAVADRDGGDTPEIFALYEAGQSSRIDVFRLGPNWELETSFPVSLASSQIAAIGAIDYDGDGRADVQILDDSGQLWVYVGNTSTGIAANRWFKHPVQTCTGSQIKLDYDGLFHDDDGSIFEAAIDKLGLSGISKGCNPPFNDEFCPTQNVTRGQMAAFLSRALGYTDDGGGDLFTDDDGHLFESSIDKLGAAGVTLGCNPPANTRFCPDQLVSRGQMAAFLVRALGYTDDGGGDLFIDDDSSVFESAIDKLGTAGVTLGCNPPTNDRFCPTLNVSRAQMAAFLARALDL